jgi:uncharacterized protein
MMGITSLIVIQPTPFCNIDCSYCYLPNRNDRTTLQIGDLQRMFEKLLAFPTISQEVTVVWHAGEPLVLGIDYYEAAFSAISKVCPPGLKINHAFQTNGILINDRWCDFFVKWNVGVGVSIDGPKSIHDAARKTRSGRGTYDKAVAAIGRLKKKDISFYVISVLTRAALLDPDGMFAFFEEYGIQDVGFNIEEEEGIHRSSSLSGDFNDDLVIRFFVRFTELMTDRQFAITVRELEETLNSILYLQQEGPINNLAIPFGILTIDVRGDVSTFSPELAGYSSEEFTTFSIGNIYEHSFAELENSPTLQRMSAQIKNGIELCRVSCKYFPVCGGGTPSNKIFENGTFASTETMHCRLTKKRVTDFMLAKIESVGASGSFR